MGRFMSRDAVGCASGLNWCAFILMLFATISSYWTWGRASTNPASGIATPVTVVTGPWVASWAFGSVAVPCNCQGGWCYSWCTLSTFPLYWSQISAENACAPASNVFRYWSGPLGYCTFPPGSNITWSPPLAPTFGPPDAVEWVGIQNYSVPPGTVFNMPSQVPALQALSIISTITVFFAALAGCGDAGMEGGSKGAGISASACSLIAWVFCLAAFCLWTTFPYVAALQQVNPTVWMPIWVNTATNTIGVIKVYDAYLGPGWGTALAAFLMIFFAFLVHCVSIMDNKEPDEPAFVPKNDPEMAQTQPASDSAMPTATATPVVVTTAAVPPAVGAGAPTAVANV